MLLTVFLLAFLPARAFEINLVAENQVNAYDTWEIHAYVINGSVNVTYPDCNIDITKGGAVVINESMLQSSEYASTSTSFDEAGTYTANVLCYGDNDAFSFSVSGNSDVNLELGVVSGLGDSLQMFAEYVDGSNYPIYPGNCEARIYVESSYEGTVDLYYNSGQEAYIGWYTIGKSGEHSVTATCSASGYTTASDTGRFDIERFPVTISPSMTSTSGSYGEQRQVSISVSPYTAECGTSFGNLNKVTSTHYNLFVDLNFLGEKSAIVTCSAPEHTTSSKTIKFSVTEKATRLSAGFSTEKPFSFQKFYVTPNYYDEGWGQIKDASCTVEFEGATKEVKSFESAWFRAAPGPKETSVKLSCSKYGYKSVEGVAIFDIQPIIVTGDLQYPGGTKLEEPLVIQVGLYPQIEADCEFEAGLKSIAGDTVERYRQNATVKGTGSFSLVPEETGDLEFRVSCHSLGYTEFHGSGVVPVSVFSQEEETSATIILTILTLILAVGFLLLKRWV